MHAKDPPPFRIVKPPHPIRPRFTNVYGVKAVVAAMKAHRDHAGVQEAACGALKVLGASRETRVSKFDKSGRCFMIFELGFAFHLRRISLSKHVAP